MLGGISIWQLLIVLAIIVLIFGTKKMRNLGSDLGNALKGFKKAVKEDDEQVSEASDAEFTQLDEEKIEHDEPVKPKTVKKTAAKKSTTAKKPAAKKKTTTRSKKSSS